MNSCARNLLGLNANAVKLLSSYLNSRSQFVSINEIWSDCKPILLGVLQGSVLGPILFLIFINDLSLQPFIGDLYQYADDSTLLYDAKSVEQLRHFIEHDFQLLMNYMNSNGICINIAKTQIMKFSTNRRRFETLEVSLGGNIIVESSHVRFLGLTIDKHLTWHQHMTTLNSKLSSVCGIIFKLRTKIDEFAKMMIYRSLAESLIMYMNIIWAWKETNFRKKVQVTQNKLLKCVFNLPRRFPTNDLYKIRPGLMRVNEINIYQRCLYIFKTLHLELSELVQPSRVPENHNLRSANQPRINLTHLTLTEQRITFHGVDAYNKLTSNIKSSTNISIFKKRLREHLQI